MPLYEYECDACRHRFEIIQKIADPPVEICPRCGAPVHKLHSAPAFQFKGTGWYITDYARKDAGAGSEKPAAEKKADGEAGGAGGEKADATKTASPKSGAGSSAAPRDA
jgi:putative FmdB family regulatory protein